MSIQELVDHIKYYADQSKFGGNSTGAIAILIAELEKKTHHGPITLTKEGEEALQKSIYEEIRVFGFDNRELSTKKLSLEDLAMLTDYHMTKHSKNIIEMLNNTFYFREE